MAAPWLKSYRFTTVLFANPFSTSIGGLFFMWLLVLPVLRCHAQPSGNSTGTRPYLETPYSTLVPYEDERQALTLNPGNSGYYRNLTSLWKVNDTAATEGGALAVAFDIPENWQNRQTFLCFSVLKAPVKVFVNGKAVDTLKQELPAKLNITSFLQRSGNLIELQSLDGNVKEEGFTSLADSAYAFSGANIHVKDIEPFGLADPDVPRACFEYRVKDYKGQPWHLHDLLYYLKVYRHEGKEILSYDTFK
ncbi:beta-galactosidase, partial [Pontibacter sp. BAB1700]|uniref:beta-galactosidase n=1 Tax=Pontibacter sp. BAB1700 TaxID=1144253 RepID=UPI00026BD27D